MLKCKSGSIRNRHGFTLIEVVLSVVIIAIIATSFLTMFSQGYSSIFKMGRRTTAVNDAQQFTESVYANKGAFVTATVGSATADGWMKVADSAVIPAESLNGKYYFIEESVNFGKTMHKITVVRFYSDGSQSIRLTAIVP